MAFEVITFGEAMIRLSPPGFRRIEQAKSLDLQVGGAELNTAVAVSRLGHSASWISRLPDNPLGRLVANHAREAGVDTSHVMYSKDERLGLSAEKPGCFKRFIWSRNLFDRRHCF
jgi:2-dehydro-3-deoxygluconokinase